MSQFGVDLRGVIDLLSRHIYSGPEVYLRELLQNSRDAIVARAAGGDPDPAWGVRIHPATAEAPFVLADDGVGLAAGEIEDLLATVGRSSKRDMLDLPHGDYLGHFGIGLLSCFMVADEIRILSHKAGHRAVVWTGRADGTYAVEELSDAQTEAIDIGTRVTLAPSAERIALLGERRVRELATEYGEFLPLPVSVGAHDGPITSLTTAPPFLPGGDREAALAYGETLLGHRPLDVIDLSIRATGTTGVAYVLAKPLAGRGHRGARVYLGRMLLNADEQAIVPEWGFFLLPVVTSDHLTPTASREQLVKDDAVDTTRDGIAAAFRAWVKRVATTNRPLLDAFLRAHDQSIRAACVDDEQLLRVLGPFLTFETT
ncbi:MAG: ATP-binding protein, partial [Demequina sp.]|uniref:ATP-binding protein n=1 Tax=Demequina sp. TaxID=2050685 RepID=UPI003A84DAB6